MDKTDELAKILWGYNQMHHKPTKSDAIIALGSMDTRVADRAAELWEDGIAPVIIVSGGFGRLTGSNNSETEAAKFKKILLSRGVPEASIYVEDKSTNTSENLDYSLTILKQIRPDPKLITIVTKPYMEKRAYATFIKKFPQYKCVLSSPRINYEAYPKGEITKELMINVMVGDTQRLIVYPQKGFIAELDVPSYVKDAMKQLIDMGFDQQLAK